MDQILQDRHGRALGRIRNEGNQEVIYDSHGHRLGYFDGRSTFDNHGRKIGQGNLLTTFLNFSN